MPMNDKTNEEIIDHILKNRHSTTMLKAVGMDSYKGQMIFFWQGTDGFYFTGSPDSRRDPGWGGAVSLEEAKTVARKAVDEGRPI